MTRGPNRKILHVAPPRQRVAIIGSGVSGLSSAWLLKDRHEVTLFEAQDRVGGHSNTVDITVDGQTMPVDVGFIVFNRPNYPHFIRLLEALGVASQPTDMSFGVSLNATSSLGALEYGSRAGVLGLFAQKRNWVNPRYIHMLLETWRYMRAAKQHLDDPAAVDITLGEFLDQGRYSTSMIEDHILPMAAAIWSGTANRLRDFPARTYFQFFRNHGLLGVNDWLQWETVTGGSRSYVQRVLADLPDGTVKTNSPVQSVTRSATGAVLHFADRPAERFDQVIFACHSDETLALLGEGASDDERKHLGAIGFQDNVAYLHNDATWLPKREAARSAWNYVGARRADLDQPATVSYWMNLLQDLPTKSPVVLTLNPTEEIAERHVWRKMYYRHPQFDAAAIAAQRSLHRLQGKQQSWFAGAWAGFGFHEDGIQSAVAVARAFGCAPAWDAEVEPVSSAADAAHEAVLTPASAVAIAAE